MRTKKEIDRRKGKGEARKLDGSRLSSKRVKLKTHRSVVHEVGVLDRHFLLRFSTPNTMNSLYFQAVHPMSPHFDPVASND